MKILTHFLFVLLTLVAVQGTSQNLNISGNHRVCPGDTEDYAVDFQTPDNFNVADDHVVITTRWNVPGGIINFVTFHDGTTQDVDNSKFASIFDSNSNDPTPIPVEANITWGQSPVQIGAGQQVRINGGQPVNTTGLLRTRPSLSSNGIEALGSLVYCEKYDCFTLIGDLGNADSFDWIYDPNQVSCSDSDSLAPEFCILTEANGPVIILFTVEGCGGFSRTFSQELWFGTPQPEIEIRPNLWEEKGCVPPNTNITICIDETPGLEVERWEIPGTPSVEGEPQDPVEGEWYNYDFESPNKLCMRILVGETPECVSVWVKNECGSTSVSKCIEICDDQGEGPGADIRSRDEEEIEFQVFPNPFMNELTVEFISVSESDFEFTLSDMAGQLVDSGRMLAKKGVNTIKIDNAAALSSGLYLLKLTSPNEEYIAKVLKGSSN